MKSDTLKRDESPFGPILVVEDSVPHQRLIALHLQGSGYQVDAVLNGAEAVKVFKPGHYSLILMDLSMPEMNGLDATLRIRSQEQDNPTPVLILTGDDSGGMQNACLKVGANAVLVKPVRRDDLLQACNRYGRPISPNTDRPPIDWPPILNKTSLTELKADTSAEMLPKLTIMLLEESADYVREIERLVQQGDLSECQHKAHALKSSAATIGAERLSHMAKQLHSAWRRKSRDQVHSTAIALRKVMLETSRVYEHRLIWHKE